MQGAGRNPAHRRADRAGAQTDPVSRTAPIEPRPIPRSNLSAGSSIDPKILCSCYLQIVTGPQNYNPPTYLIQKKPRKFNKAPKESAGNSFPILFHGPAA